MDAERISVLERHGIFMENLRLFRKRFLPDEIIELKDDVILSQSDTLIITKWNVLKPREDISHGISAYFIDQGIKVSKIYNARNKLVYWYCDIIDTSYDNQTHSYIFTDLLIDVIIYPDKTIRVVDIDEFADIMEQNTLDNTVIVRALRQTNALLECIYAGHFSKLTSYIDEAEKAING